MLNVRRSLAILKDSDRVRVERVELDSGGEALLKTVAADDGESFLREVEVLRRVKSPALTGLIDAGLLPDGRAYLLRDWVDGRTLAEAIPELDCEARRAVALGVLDALGELHRAGLFHADLKPANVLLPRSGTIVARLADFGMSGLQSTENESPGPGGSAFYLSPEQILGLPRTHLIDLFAFGVLLFELYGGRLPDDVGRFYARFPQEPFLACVDSTAFEPRLRGLLRRLCAVDPDQRPVSVFEVRRELAAAGFAPADGAIAPAIPRVSAHAGWRPMLDEVYEKWLAGARLVGVLLEADEDVPPFVREWSLTAAVQRRRFVHVLCERDLDEIPARAVVVLAYRRDWVEKLLLRPQLPGTPVLVVVHLSSSEVDPLRALQVAVLGPFRLAPSTLAEELFLAPNERALSRPQRTFVEGILEAGRGRLNRVQDLLERLARDRCIGLGAEGLEIKVLDIDWVALARVRPEPDEPEPPHPSFRRALSFFDLVQGPVPDAVARQICAECELDFQRARFQWLSERRVRIDADGWRPMRTGSRAADTEESARQHALLANWFAERSGWEPTAFVHRVQSGDSSAAGQYLIAHRDAVVARGADLVAAAAETLAEQRLEGDAEDGTVLLEVARLLLRAGRNQKATGLITLALEHRRIRGEPRDALLLLLGKAHLQATRLKEARDAFELGQRRTRGTAAEVEFLQGLVDAQVRSGNADAALSLLDAALKRPGERTPTQQLQLMLSQTTALMRARSLDAALDAARRGIALSRQGGETPYLAMFLTHLGEIQRRMGQPRLAVDSAREAVQLREAAGQVHEAAALHSNLGVYLKECAKFLEAGHHLTTALEMRRSLGDGRGMGIALANLAILHLDQGLLAKARAAFHEAEPWIDQHAEARVLDLVDLHRLRLSWWSGQRRGFTRDLAALIERCRKDGESDIEIEARLLHVERAMRAGRWEWVDAELRQVEGAARDLRDGRLGTRIDFLKAMFRRSIGDTTNARRLVSKVRPALAGTLLEVDLELESCVVEAEFPGSDSLESIEKNARAGGNRRALLEALVWRWLWYRRRSDSHGVKATERAIEEVLEAIEPGAAPRLRARVVASLLALRRAALTARRRKCGALAEEDDTVQTHRDLLRTFLTINKRLSLETDVPRLLQYIVETAMSLASGQRGFVILQKGEETEFEASSSLTGGNVTEPERALSFTFLREALKSMRPLVTTNAGADPRFREKESVTQLDLRSILCVPFRVDDETLGALYLDNPIRESVFGEREIEVIDALADQAALAIKNLRARQRIDQLNQQLRKRVAVQSSDLEMARRALVRVGEAGDDRRWIGVSPKFEEVDRLITRLAATELSVLITGESGTGKELAARGIHDRSARSERPWVAENCSAIPETLLEAEFFGVKKGAFTGADRDRQGLFELAHGGTFFLDEVADLPLPLQAKLLRVLQEHAVRPLGSDHAVPIDVRIVCATNRDLRALVADGRFREDLFYRIAAAEVRMPPLRERREDIVPLARSFLAELEREFNRRLKLDAATEARLAAFPWPGNIRQLRNEVHRAFALSDGTALEWNPGGMTTAAAPGLGLDRPITLLDLEKEAIRAALGRTRGNKEEAARSLGISRASIYEKIKRFELRPETGSSG